MKCDPPLAGSSRRPICPSRPRRLFSQSVGGGTHQTCRISCDAAQTLSETCDVERPPRLHAADYPDGKNVKSQTSRALEPGARILRATPSASLRARGTAEIAKTAGLIPREIV